MLTDGQTDMTSRIVGFSNFFSKAPKKRHMPEKMCKNMQRLKIEF